MHNLSLELQPSVRSLSLKAEEGNNLFYVVELEQQGDEPLTFYKGENYKQAAYVARKVFTWLKENTSESFDILAEAELGRGITYTNSEEVDTFPTSLEEEKEDIYDIMCDEFSYHQLNYMHDLNLLFRRLVNQFKLNEYQEQKFLKRLKKLGYV